MVENIKNQTENSIVKLKYDFIDKYEKKSDFKDLVKYLFQIFKLIYLGKHFFGG